MSALVSVILPVYNASDSIDRCVRSIMNQTMKAIELIIVDDGSTDESGIFADNYAAKDASIHVIHQDNRGVSMARNTGIAAATGDFIAFVDSDDYAAPNLYERMYQASQESEADVVSCSMHRVWEDFSELVLSEDRVVDLQQGSRASKIEKCIFGEYRFRISSWGKLYKRKLIFDYNVQFLGERMEDAVFNIEALMVANRVRILSDPLYYYHKRPGSITMSTIVDPSFPIRHVSLIKQIQTFAHKYQIIDRIDEMLPQYYLRFLKSALVATAQGDTYKYIYSVLKKLYAEDENFKVLLSRVKAPKEPAHTIRGRLWVFYRHSFTWACSKGFLRIAAFLFWRQREKGTK